MLVFSTKGGSFEFLIAEKRKRGTTMATIVAHTKVKRKSGYLYFLDKKGNVACAKMARGRKKGKVSQTVVARVGVKRKQGFLYFIDKKGNVACAKMNRGGRRSRR